MEEFHEGILNGLPSIVSGFPRRCIFQNMAANKSLSSSKPGETMAANIEVLTKEEYIQIVREERAKFVHGHFGTELNEFFKQMKQEASKMRNCHFEITVRVPDNFDVNKTEEVLRNYFKDIHYEAIPEPRKEDTNKVVLTLT